MWVMGEQGARSLRGDNMIDVIFAGANGRSPLGRAEVSLTIDNSDGQLPIEFTEVTITRTLFRNGGSEYSINGNACRLLDVQELLSDTGLGKQMHVIVGQGKLDTILYSTPVQRRSFIEEAAGILKYRRRKERSLKKIDSTQGNLLRLKDLNSELQRQLEPLARQAKTARKAAVLQARFRDLSLRLLADDAVAQVNKISYLSKQLKEFAAQQRFWEEKIIVLRSENEVFSKELAAIGQSDQVLGSEIRRLRNVKTNLEKIQDVIHERLKLNENFTIVEVSQSEIEQLNKELEDLGEQLFQLIRQENDLETRIDTQLAQESALRTERNVAELKVREIANQVAQVRNAKGDRERQILQLSERENYLQQRLATINTELLELEMSIAQISREHVEVSDLADLEEKVAAGSRSLADLGVQRKESKDTVALFQKRITDTAREIAKTQAEVNIWTQQIPNPANLEQLAVLPTVASVIEVPERFTNVLRSALGELAQGVLVSEQSSYWSLLKGDFDAGGSVIVVRPAFAGGASETSQVVELPTDCRWLCDLISVPEEYVASVSALLGNWVLVPDEADLKTLQEKLVDCVLITEHGKIVQAAHAVLGHREELDVFALRNRIKAATERIVELQTAEQQLHREITDCAALDDELLVQEQAQAVLVQNYKQRLGEFVFQQKVHLKSLGEKEQSLANRKAELAKTVTELEQTRARLAEQQRLGHDALEVSNLEAEQEKVRLQSLGVGEAFQKAQLETAELRYLLRNAKQQIKDLKKRQDALQKQVTSLLSRKDSAEAQLAARQLRSQRNERLAEIIVSLLGVVSKQLNERYGVRNQLQSQIAEHTEMSTRQLSEINECSLHLKDLNEKQHSLELQLATLNSQRSFLEDKCRNEFAIELSVLMEDFGPHQLVYTLEDSADQSQDDALGRPFERDLIAQVAERCSHELAKLGKVNPLALEEYDAQFARQAFLHQQIADVEKSKADLLAIVAEIDSKVETVFSSAFADVARVFEEIFPILFPGGKGRIWLTDPDDLLGSGVEISAQPAGTKVNKLSLLSGGQRSLAAIGLLVAIFQARPSPFYVLDEVEAALDDANLGRLLEVLTALGVTSQLIIITHQKRTMEIADVLYGISMNSDGVSLVLRHQLSSNELQDR